MESEKTAVPQTAYKGTAATVPGKIEAENYDEGGHNKAFYDNDRENQGKAYREDEVDVVDISDSKCGDAACTGYAIGYTNEGEWVEYTVNVTADAKYNITANIATAFETAGMQLFVDDKAITEAITFEKVDSVFTTYKVVDVGSVELKKGEHVLKLLITGAYLNVDWLQFTDPNGTISIAKDVHLDVHAQTTFDVYGLSGQYMGRVELQGETVAKALARDGFARGIYMVRDLGHSKAFRVQVK
jgi:hypothetical protein